MITITEFTVEKSGKWWFDPCRWVATCTVTFDSSPVPLQKYIVGFGFTKYNAVLDMYAHIGDATSKKLFKKVVKYGME